MSSKIKESYRSKEQNIEDIDGYFYEGADAARWPCEPVIPTGFLIT